MKIVLIISIILSIIFIFTKYPLTFTVTYSLSVLDIFVDKVSYIVCKFFFSNAGTLFVYVNKIIRKCYTRSSLL